MEDAYRRHHHHHRSRYYVVPTFRTFGCCTWGCCPTTEKNNAVNSRLTQIRETLNAKLTEKKAAVTASTTLTEEQKRMINQHLDEFKTTVAATTALQDATYAPSQDAKVPATSALHELFYKMHEEMTQMEQENAYMKDRLSGAIDG